MLKPLEYYRENWVLNNITPLTETPRGQLFKVQTGGEAAILKIYTDEGIEHERRGAEFLEYCPDTIAVKVLQKDDGAILLEYLPGGDLRNWVIDGRDDEATHKIAAMAVQIAKVPIPEKHEFPDLRRWFQALFEVAENDNNPYQTYFSDAAAVAKDLLAENRQPVLLHGDLHHDNIMFSDEGLPKIIDAKGLIGDPAYEVANSMHNPYIDGIVTKDRILRQSEILSEVMSIDKQRLLAYGYIHAWLSCAWSMRDEIHLDENSLGRAKLFYEIVK